MNHKKTIVSIITPAYNRAELLGRCYESLLAQTCMDFEWIVVDDGSKDHTKEVMQEILARDNPFAITFVTKENGGKHTALNAAHPYLHGSYVLILDSDDWLTTDAVEEVKVGWSQFEDDQSVAMVTFLKQKSNGDLCAKAADEYVPTDVLHYQRIRVTAMDCCEVLRAELFKKYPFPVFGEERFLAETALWYRAGLDGSCIYINKVIYICEYLEGGLTASGRKMRVNNPLGGMYTSYLRMNPRCFMKERVKSALLFVCYGRYAGKHFTEILREAKDQKALCLLAWIPGTLMYHRWRKKF